MHPEDLLAAIHEFHTQDNYHKNLDESFKEEINQEINKFLKISLQEQIMIHHPF